MDVAVAVDQTGKLTFAKNAEGDFYFDDRAVGAVFGTLFAHVGEYAEDATVGTTLHTVTKSGRATATRLVTAATDALQQVKADKLLSSYDQPTATRLVGGAWELVLPWKVPSGPVTQRTRL